MKEGEKDEKQYFYYLYNWEIGDGTPSFLLLKKKRNQSEK